MGIMSQLRDQAGGNVDMGTLAELLQGLAQGRHVDTTPFGMWGVREMNPGQLGGLMNAAEGEWTKTQANRENADALRRNSMNQLAGEYDRNDAAYESAMAKLMGEREATAGRWNEANLKSRTDLDKQRLANQGALGVAETQAGVKAGKIQPMPPAIMQEMLTRLSAPDAKPNDVAIRIAMLKASNYDTTPIEAALQRMQADREAKKTAKGPSIWSRLGGALGAGAWDNPNAEMQQYSDLPNAGWGL